MWNLKEYVFIVLTLIHFDNKLSNWISNIIVEMWQNSPPYLLSLTVTQWISPTNTVNNSPLSRIMFIAFGDINIFSSFLYFPFFLFTVKQREMTGKTTALSFLDVYTQIHTQRKQYLQLLVGVLHMEVTGGLSCSNSTNIELYINFTIELSQLIIIPSLFDKP